MELGWDIYASTGSSNNYYHFSGIGGGENAQFVDLNGDSLPDMLYGKYFYLNTGRGFAPGKALGFDLNNDQAIAESLNFVDYNHDGLTDLFYAKNNNTYIRIWNGQNFSAAKTINANYYGSENNYFIDMNGDGARDYVNIGGATPAPAPDPTPKPTPPPPWGGCGPVSCLDAPMPLNVVMSSATGSTAYIQLAKKGGKSRDVITRITSSLGAETDISYQSLINTGVYTRGTGAIKNIWGKGSPVFDFTAPTYVVSQVASSAPVANSNGSIASTAKSSVSYRYAGARIQGGGRGFLGFETLASTDNQTGTVTETTYRQDFPYIGMPSRTRVKTSSGQLLSDSTNQWDSKKSGKVYQPYLKKSIEKSYDLAVKNKLLKTVTTTQTVDSYGNVTNMAVTTAGGGISNTKTTVSQYANNTSKWHLGRLLNSTVTTRQGSSTQVRKSAFEYSSTKGLLTKEIVEPDDAAFRLVTAYGYDQWGNKLSSTVSGNGITTRMSRGTYSTGGLYGVTQVNALSQVTRRVLERDAFGRVLRSADINGVESALTYDAMGRKVAERHASGAGKDYAYFTCGNAPVSCPTTGALVTQVTPVGAASAWEIQDLIGRTIRKVTTGFDGKKVIVDSQYDNLSRPVRVSEPYYEGDPVYWNSTQYDILGRATQVTNANGDSETVSYSGYNTVKTNVKGHNTTEVHNALGQLVQVTDNLNNTVEYQYDLQGNLTHTLQSASDTSAQAVTTITYDRLGRKTGMDDADKGQWSYQYNVLGQLTQQTDAKGQKVQFTYDLLGRKLTRIDRRANNTIEGNTSWTYDDGTKGVLSEVSDSVTGFGQVLSYDSYGRPTGVGTTFDGEMYTQSTKYDSFGRVSEKRDAVGTSSGIRYVYNAQGYMEVIQDLNGNREWYRVNSVDARGNATVQTIGGMQQTKYFDPRTGFLETLKTGFAGSNIQDLSYSWDAVGNLEHRIDKSTGSTLTETFGYDGLNRVTSATIGSQSDQYRYNGLGNITSKTGVGNYTYGQNGAGIHAVTHTSTGNISYQYDTNGNMTSGGGRTLEYSTFDKPTRITKGGHTTQFQYDINRSRYKRVDTDGSNNTTITRYVGNVEFITRPNGDKETKRYINGVVIDTTTTNSGGGTESSVQLLFKDHLGSIHTIMDGNAMTLLQRQSFDPFGQRRNATNWQDLLDSQLSSFNTSYTTRGFTGHEQLDEVGLIHMNGRVYDPKLGRFLQADPFIQAVGNTQSFNRYSYVLNNPLNAVDPSGYFFGKLFKAFKKAVSGLFKAVNKLLGDFAPIAAIAIGIFLPGAQFMISAFGQFGAAVASGFIAGGVASGSLKGAVAGAFSAAVFYGIGSAFEGTGADVFGSMAHVGKTLAHGVAGGIMSVLNGGKFGHGFISAGVVQMAAPGINNLGVKGSRFSPARVFAAALVGGTASKLTGGKFANGAVTGAFSRTFNDDRHYKETHSFSEVKETKWRRKFVDGKNVTMTDKYGDPKWGDLDGVLGTVAYAADIVLGRALNLDYQAKIQHYGEYEMWEQVEVTKYYEHRMRSLSDYDETLLSISDPVLTGRHEWRPTGLVTDTKQVDYTLCPISCGLIHQ